MTEDTFLVILAYLLFGVLGAMFIDMITDGEMNPLWKIPLILLGPFNGVLVVVIVVVFLIKNYIDEVRDYYRRKNKERRVAREHEEDISDKRTTCIMISKKIKIPIKLFGKKDD